MEETKSRYFNTITYIKKLPIVCIDNIISYTVTSGCATSTSGNSDTCGNILTLNCYS